MTKEILIAKLEEKIRKLQIVLTQMFPRAVYKDDLPPEPQNSPVVAPVVPPAPIPTLLWDTPQQAYKSTRILCKQNGLNLDNEDIICATIFGESEFEIMAVGENGASTDYSICQFNDGPPGVPPWKRWWIGPGKLFSSPEDVFANPRRQVVFMINYLKKNGHLNIWYAYKNKEGAFVYKKHLLPNSPMRKLAT